MVKHDIDLEMSKYQIKDDLAQNSFPTVGINDIQPFCPYSISQISIDDKNHASYDCTGGGDGRKEL